MSLWKNGFIRAGRWNGVPIRIHWATPIGLFVLAGFRLNVTAMLAMAFVILVHELGHAWVVMAVGARPSRVELLPMGGLCHWAGDVTPVGRSLISWGGVLGQLALALVTLGYVAIAGQPHDRLASEVVYCFTLRSAYMAAFNLLPIPPLDGVEAWKLFPRWWRARRFRPVYRSQPPKPIFVPPPEAPEIAATPEVKAMVEKLFNDARK